MVTEGLLMHDMQVAQQRGQAGGAGGDRHAGACRADLCAALSQLFRQGHATVQSGACTFLLIPSHTEAPLKS